MEEFDLFRADPFILLPVRITRRKNIEYALRVVAELRALGPRPMLLVTGPRGPHDPASITYVQELQSLIDRLGLGDDAILLQADGRDGARAWKPTDAMMDQLYRAADLMLLPSAQEGFGIPLLEAGVVSLPIFCSNIPPFREILGERAHYFQLDEPPLEVARRMADFLRSDARYRLRKRIAQQYAWNTIFDDKLVPLLSRTAARAAPIGGK